MTASGAPWLPAGGLPLASLLPFFPVALGGRGAGGGGGGRWATLRPSDQGRGEGHLLG